MGRALKAIVYRTSKLRAIPTQNKDQTDSSVVQLEDERMVWSYDGIEVEDLDDE